MVDLAEAAVAPLKVGLVVPAVLAGPAALAARQLARSYGAAVTLGQKALLNQQAENDPDSQNDLMRALGISPLLPDQQTSTASQNPPSSTKPETFGSKT